MTDFLRVGGAAISFTEAREIAGRYLRNESGTYAYPAYDTYPGTPGGELGRQDLLAITLLNAGHNAIETYYGLEKLLPELNRRLAHPALAGTFEDARPNTLGAIAELLGITSDFPTRFVPGPTKVAKIVHLKKPELLPLFDKNIVRCYSELGDPPVPKDPERSWKGYLKAWLPAVKDDLISQLASWQELAALAPGPKISPLRALDIVGWELGRRGNGPE
ncbi:DUF6308 family protein [Arthrobacter sp. Marseille-P9274]|uniref:DUF6308 family protein n=1 Tax=Arthrobacter sp. Marseille-P9274 TaxID=2866572 RepID=UPI0021C67948|nr:DUF6308 family protein [Arthrobacter sp. Marseille-P9274]